MHVVIPMVSRLYSARSSFRIFGSQYGGQAGLKIVAFFKWLVPAYPPYECFENWADIKSENLKVWSICCFVEVFVELMGPININVLKDNNLKGLPR